MAGHEELLSSASHFEAQVRVILAVMNVTAINIDLRHMCEVKASPSKMADTLAAKAHEAAGPSAVWVR